MASWVSLHSEPVCTYVPPVSMHKYQSEDWPCRQAYKADHIWLDTPMQVTQVSSYNIGDQRSQPARSIFIVLSVDLILLVFTCDHKQHDPASVSYPLP